MNTHPIYRFDGFQVDPAKRELRRDGRRIPLQPKAFDCLAYLIEHRDRVVGKDELIAAVWGRIELTDRALGLALNRARQALGDTGEEHRIIRTVTRVGYSWVLPVEAIDAGENTPGGEHRSDGEPSRSAAAADSEPPPSHLPEAADPARTHEPQTGRPASGAPHSPPAAGNGRLAVALAAVLLLALLATAVPPMLRPPSADAPGRASSREDIALILPVAVVGDASSSWIRLGLMDLIAERLRAVGLPVVPSDNTVALARSLPADAPPAPDELRALAKAATASLLMSAEAESIRGHWRVTLRTLHGREPALIAEGDSDDVLKAARAAADRMATLLGHDPIAATPASPEEHDVELAIQQIKTALLSDRVDEARAAIARLPEQQRALPPIRYHLAQIDRQQGRFHEAKAGYQALLDDLPPDADAMLRARVLTGLAHTLFVLGEDERVDELHVQAAQLLEGMPSHEARNLLGHVLMNRSAALDYAGRYDQAQEGYARARLLFESTGDQLSLARLESNWSILFGRVGRHVEAVAYAGRSAERARTFGDVPLELRARYNLLVNHNRLLDAPSALAHMRRIDELLAQVSNANLKKLVGTAQAETLLHAGRVSEALARLRETASLDTGGAVSSEWPEALLAQQALATGEPARAQDYAERALDQAWDPQDPHPHAGVWLTLLRAQAAQDQRQATARTAEAFQSWAGSVPDADLTPYAALFRAEHAAFASDRDTARAAFERALAEAGNRSAPALLMAVVQPYAEWLIRIGDTERASVVAGLTAGWSEYSYDAALLQTRLYHALGEAAAWRLAIDRARALAGEREIPPELAVAPEPRAALSVR